MTAATATSKLFSTRNGLSLEVREQMVELLNQQLAGVFDLFSQTKQAHWNVKEHSSFRSTSCSTSSPLSWTSMRT
jgi:starvation-inducible DNA-binding protein